MGCAVAYIPFYKNCENTIIALFDTADGKKDKRATAYFDFEDKCSQMSTAPCALTPRP